ncbi:MAG TPA: type II toxin-antitoxin system ParD family antitoxin [Armatimonadota bacterium]|nr:type II toxin-antitoxin system ParD family antitoxin [Armatimonadota bacterium]
MPTVTISIPDTLREFVESEVRTKGYGNVSEYFGSLVREAQAKEAERLLEALLVEGLDSGTDIEVTPQVWADLEAEARGRSETELCV